MMSGPMPASRSSTWRYATALALTAAACGLLLGGLSAWFLGSVAIAGMTAAAFTFNFHIPGALVRLFAVGRTAARYGERLLGHKAALADQVEHRVRLFTAMAASPVVRRAGWQLGDQARMADYIDDVEDIDYAKLRASLPAIALCTSLAACALATASVAPLALAMLIVLAAILLLQVRATATTGAVAWERTRSLRREGAQRLGVTMVSAIPLQAENVWRAACDNALEAFDEADENALALKQTQARLDMMTTLIGPVMALSVVGASWFGGARSDALLIPVFVAFAWIASGEMVQNLSRILVAVLRQRMAETAMQQWRGEVATVVKFADAQTPEFLENSSLQLISPTGRSLGASFALRLQKGKPTVLVGPSGSGKTSLLKQIAGWIGDDAFIDQAGPVSSAERRVLSMLCLHDAAILSDTVRANLFAPDLPDKLLSEALDAVEMSERIKTAGGLDAWISQDQLSLGEAQRLNLARTFLSSKSVVLLDEPTEHLSATQGSRILERLLTQLNDRIVVLSSHSESLPERLVPFVVSSNNPLCSDPRRVTLSSA